MTATKTKVEVMYERGYGWRLRTLSGVDNKDDWNRDGDVYRRFDRFRSRVGSLYRAPHDWIEIDDEGHPSESEIGRSRSRALQAVNAVRESLGEGDSSLLRRSSIRRTFVLELQAAIAAIDGYSAMLQSSGCDQDTNG